MYLRLIFRIYEHEGLLVGSEAPPVFARWLDLKLHRTCVIFSRACEILRETNVELREENPKTSPENPINTFCAAP